MTPPYLLDAACSRNKIRNLKSEIRNEFKTQNPKVPNHAGENTPNRWDREVCFEPLVFDSWVCFGFRAVDFEFPRCAQNGCLLSLHDTATELSNVSIVRTSGA
jgi:hypothetical protein